MCRHDHIDIGIHRRLERDELARLELGIGAVDEGKAGVAVRGGIAVAGEMLRGGDDAVVGQTAEESGPHLTDERRIRRERTDIDDRVARLIVDVHDGREVHVDANGSELLTDDRGIVVGELRIARGTERHAAAGVRTGAEADDGTALLVDCGHDRDAERTLA